MKKVKRFEIGGDIKERARRFAELADKPEEQAAYQRSVHDTQQAEAEASDRARSAPTPAPKATAPAPKATAPAPKAAAPASSTSNDRESPSQRSAPAMGKFTDSDAESRAARQSESDDENVRRIERARSEADNTARIDRAKDAAYKGQYSPEAKAARLARSAANADRGGMSPEAEKAVERAGAVASVIPAVRGAGVVAKGAQKAAEAVGRQAAVRKGLASEAQQWGASAPAANRARDIAQDVRGAAREAITQRRTQAEAARKARDEAAVQSKAMREEARQFGSNLPKSLRERAEEAGSKVAEKAKRMFSRSSPKSNKPRFGEGADDAYQAGYKKGGKVGASRGDGIAQRGHTRGKYL